MVVHEHGAAPRPCAAISLPHAHGNEPHYVAVVVAAILAAVAAAADFAAGLDALL